MAVAKSPFLVFRNFMSPKQCEHIVNNLGFFNPDVNESGEPLKMSRYNEDGEESIFHRLEPMLTGISNYYGIQYKGTERMKFEFLAQGVEPEPRCENSEYLRKKWTQVRQRDITGVIFLSTYREDAPFDDDYEVYGGKLEFLQHGFGFNPERGTMILFPSGPHFINANATVFEGDLFQVRFHIAANQPFIYQPVDFPGDFTSWFKDL